MDDLGAIAGAVYQGVVKGNWWLAAVAALLLTVTAMRKTLAGRFPFLGTDHGGALLPFVLSALAAAATALAGGGAFNVALMLAALKVAWGSVGGYVALRKFWTWFLARIGMGWLASWLDKLGLGMTPEKALLRAVEAGEAAVVAKPGTGLAGVTGPPTEVE